MSKLHNHHHSQQHHDLDLLHSERQSLLEMLDLKNQSANRVFNFYWFFDYFLF
jgi:hypothetical protein